VAGYDRMLFYSTSTKNEVQILQFKQHHKKSSKSELNPKYILTHCQYLILAILFRPFDFIAPKN